MEPLSPVAAGQEREISQFLIARGEELLARPYTPIKFSGDTEADLLLNDLDQHPHAFVTACIMDRQVRAELAWSIPHRISERLGSYMARNFHSAIQLIASEYQGVASRIWEGNPSSATIVRRFLEFDGAGPKIATMAANILVREFKVPVSDRASIDISVDVQVRKVFGRLGLIRT